MSEPTKCAECGYIASGAVCTKCATPLPAPDHGAAEKFAKWYISRSDTDDDGDNLARAYLALAPHGEAVACEGCQDRKTIRVIADGVDIGRQVCPLCAPAARVTSEMVEAIALMRVTGALARRDARLPHPDYDTEAIDTAEVCWGDLRALLAAYQSVRSENEGLRDGSIVDRLREEVRALIPENRALREDKARLDWLEDHGGFETPDGKDGMSMARWGRSSDLTLRTAIDRARTGGTE